jgi:hypothetical protein
VTTPAQPQSSNTVRNLIIGAVVVVVLGVGYCATRVAKVAGTLAGSLTGIQARMDTAHHVAPGSAVFLGGAKVADIVKVVVIRADTTPAPVTHGTADSLLHAGLRQQTVLYTASAAAPALASQLGDLLLVGHVDGKYDDTVPVQITLTRRTTEGALAPGQLVVPGRRQPISVY